MARNVKLLFVCEDRNITCLQNGEVKRTIYDLMQSEQSSSNSNFLHHHAFAYIALVIDLLQK